ncbi:MAG: hypothetical protein ACPL7J_14745 [Desulfomonilaceae bacterium]
MSKKITILVCCACLLICYINIAAADQETTKSSSWSALVHEENSLLASILYLPYLIAQWPMRISDAILNPKPASQATIPPPAHQDMQQ